MTIPTCQARRTLLRAPLVLLALAAGSICGVTPGEIAAADLEEGFVEPPDAAKPRTYWWWLNGLVDREGITRDLEEMARVGVGGAQIFDVTDGIPPGPVDYMSDGWRAMVKHAVEEADRLGLELCLHNCAGWSSSGGPWITPELAMQIVTVSESRATGAARFDDQLPQPPTRLESSFP